MYNRSLFLFAKLFDNQFCKGGFTIMPNLLEIYDLLEWGEYGSSSQFWSEAKVGRLDSASF